MEFTAWRDWWRRFSLNNPSSHVLWVGDQVLENKEEISSSGPVCSLYSLQPKHVMSFITWSYPLVLGAAKKIDKDFLGTADLLLWWYFWELSFCSTSHEQYSAVTQDGSLQPYFTSSIWITRQLASIWPLYTPFILCFKIKKKRIILSYLTTVSSPSTPPSYPFTCPLP